jgi:hypothetical protein
MDLKFSQWSYSAEKLIVYITTVAEIFNLVDVFEFANCQGG